MLGTHCGDESEQEKGGKGTTSKEEGRSMDEGDANPSGAATEGDAEEDEQEKD